jgi:type II secretory pathway component GspD/PulD (secretin)
VTLVNGQKGSVKVLQQQAYVADFKQLNGEFEPQIATHSSGVSLDVTATVSADRKYVTLDAHPQVKQLVELSEVPWTKAPPGRNDLKVQVPRVTERESKLVVSVPKSETMATVLTISGAPKDQAQDQQLVVLITPRIIIRRVEQQPYPLLNERPKQEK